MDIATHPFNDSLVILIHGVMSNRYLAWKPIIDFIQNIHQKSSAPLNSYDSVSFSQKIAPSTRALRSKREFPGTFPRDPIHPRRPVLDFNQVAHRKSDYPNKASGCC